MSLCEKEVAGGAGVLNLQKISSLTCKLRADAPLVVPAAPAAERKLRSPSAHTCMRIFLRHAEFLTLDAFKT